MKHRASWMIFSAAAGGLLGYVLLHPYAMVVLWLSGEKIPDVRLSGLWTSVGMSFSRHMVSMSFAFASIGAAAGLFWALSMLRGKSLKNAVLEKERHKASLEMLEKVMLTLSHHLLNATMAIGGQIRHIQRSEPEETVLSACAIILDECARIERVVHSLRSVSQTSRSPGIDSNLLADVEKVLEQVETKSFGLSE